MKNIELRELNGKKVIRMLVNNYKHSKPLGGTNKFVEITPRETW